MPSLKEVRTRISSVKSTQKITRAMKLVAAAKLRRAQDAITAARPYAVSLGEVVADIAKGGDGPAHPMLQPKSGDKVAYLVVTSDRGLCGGFNTNVCRRVREILATNQAEGGEPIQLMVAGRKGKEFFKRRNIPVAQTFAGPQPGNELGLADEIGLCLTKAFLEGEVDEVRLVYNEFRSAISQEVSDQGLLPANPDDIAPADEAEEPTETTDLTLKEYIFEPNRAELLESLMPLYLQSQVHRALLESVASEFGARMTAMDNATSNAKSMLENLTLQYNRARQAAITKELMEIVGGAEALNG